MTLLVRLVSKLLGNLRPVVYWFGIIISALIFALLHLPFLYALIEEPSQAVIWYVILTNSLGGIVFGWLYWRRGLEMAMLAHILTHVVLVLGQA